MAVEWYIHTDTCSANCTEFSIFFETPTDPVFIWNVTNFGAHKYDQTNNLPAFNTRVTIYPNYNHALSSTDGSLVYYPFDSYKAEIFAFAQDSFTNESIPLNFLSGLKISTDVKSDRLGYLERVQPGQRDIDVVVTVQRSNHVIAYCLVITLTFWLVTLIICLIMIATVVFGFRQRNEMVVVPVGTVFSFTQLRSTMPGAPPGFGDILDTAGLLPCLVLLSISAVAMVGIYLFANPDDPRRKPLTWGEFRCVLCDGVAHEGMDM
ncbi:hypothetical protein IW261DRAFT_1420661 [Armillaria novae-zelandiae]|uniref:Uncharacterized protein n=1 Tax=Armillaria novae-zelandiae TaxID=153914 RepID=A0AA39UD18_9AGAR|nr:hypothetical protein IW261DRAFT_1420661 [Armillaria novae-zelandiae]